MTLFNQINSLLFAMFLLVISSLLYFQFTETKSFMANQMESDLNNASTSLSLMLKPHLETGDVATVDTLINVVFEGGFYKKVELTWVANQQQQEWINPVKVEGVPQWFIDLNLFKGQVTETTISSGWLQLATLKIESNPAIGYYELWRIMNNTLLLLSVIFLAAIALLQFRLKAILKPLNDVAGHAQKIAQRDFSSDIALPKTKELAKVVVAVNSMSTQLKQVFNTLDDEVHFLKNEKLLDSVSQ
ncbi:MAG: LapD/MoxY N-terminal periplasmic domain-containing protein, partial [Psychromonas sp.]